jgi:hypothetical protein
MIALWHKDDLGNCPEDGLGFTHYSRTIRTNKQKENGTSINYCIFKYSRRKKYGLVDITIKIRELSKLYNY